jgi:hypothetical protein
MPRKLQTRFFQGRFLLARFFGVSLNGIVFGNTNCLILSLIRVFLLQVLIALATAVSTAEWGSLSGYTTRLEPKRTIPTRVATVHVVVAFFINRIQYCVIPTMNVSSLAFMLVEIQSALLHENLSPSHLL